MRAVRLLFCILFLTGTAQANPTELFQKGNKALATERFEEAINAYQEAAAKAPKSAEIYYNLGNAQYRAGGFEEAIDSFEVAASLARTDSMRSQSKYNLANCIVKIGEGLREVDPHAAANHYLQAMGLYRLALDYNPEFGDAAYNLEICQRISALIKDEIRDQEEKKKQDGESNEDSENEDDSDMDYGESSEDAGLYEAANPFGDFSEYEEIRGVPPPNKTEMDILAEEVRNQDARKKKRAGEYKPVEKDW